MSVVQYGSVANFRSDIQRLLLAVYFYVGMEWLFFVTKPSFFSSYGTLVDVQVLFSTAGLFAAAALVPHLLLAPLAAGLGRIIGSAAARSLTAFIPAAVLAVLLLLMTDNFTYTVFGFGAPRLETQPLELGRHVIGGLVQPRAGGIPASHRIVGNDENPRSDVGFRDRGRGSALGRGLGRENRGKEQNDC